MEMLKKKHMIIGIIAGRSTHISHSWAHDNSLQWNRPSAHRLRQVPKLHLKPLLRRWGTLVRMGRLASHFGSKSFQPFAEPANHQVAKITLLRVIPTMTFIHFVTGKSSGILSDISSGILSGILSGISSGILSTQIFWHSIWQTFWHFIWHIFWHSIWHFIWHSIWHTFWHSTWHIF